MTTRAWRCAYASVVGTSHVKTGSPCQDAGLCRVVLSEDGQEVLVACVSDGAGSAARSEAGSQLAVASFIREFGATAEVDADLASLDRDFALRWLETVNAAIAALAGAEGLHPRDFACTFLGGVIGPRTAVYLQVGDGAMVVAGGEEGELSWIFWPQHGEFANTTNFITQELVGAVLDFERVSGPIPINEIALFSDGIERLVLDLSGKSVHSPSLRPIFQWLVTTEPGSPQAPAPGLIAYLGSDHVNRRTDDDKTLVMATRATPVTLAS